MKNSYCRQPAKAVAQMNPKFRGMLGLARRAGRLVCGESKTAEAIRNGKCFLLLLADDASPNTEKKFKNMSEFYSANMVRPGTRFELGNALGQSSVVSAAVSVEGFATQLGILLGIII